MNICILFTINIIFINYLKIGKGRYWVVANQNVVDPWTIEIIRFLKSFESLVDNVLKLHVKFTKVYKILQKANKAKITIAWLFDEVDNVE